MFEYDLKGKQVILVLDPELLPTLEACGIQGSPLAARVHTMEEAGLWLENPHFTVCPVGAKKIYGPGGETLCMVHVFIPARAIVSVVVFPSEVGDLEKDPSFHKIGFKIGR